MTNSKVWMAEDEILCQIASFESIEKAVIIDELRAGRAVILGSKINRKKQNYNACIVGNTFKKKIGVAIGMDAKETEHFNSDNLKTILNAKPDVVCDVSIGDNIPRQLSEIRKFINVPLGSCPTYDIFNPAIKGIFSEDYILSKIKGHLDAGSDFILLHMGINYEMLNDIENDKSIIPFTSRGGGALVRYMRKTGEENPLIVHLDKILSLCKEYEAVLDIGDIFRTGCLEDGNNITNKDSLKSKEIQVLKKVRNIAYQHGVQVLCEGGGHIPLNKIKEYIEWMKESLDQAPIWFNGPLPSDRAVGFDSIANSIGIAVAAQYGGDLFLALTDAEHYAKPTPLQSAQAIRTLKVALSVAEYSLKNEHEVKKNHCMGKARRELNWENQAESSLFPDIAKNLFIENGLTKNSMPCNLCGPLCPYLVVGK